MVESFLANPPFSSLSKRRWCFSGPHYPITPRRVYFGPPSALHIIVFDHTFSPTTPRGCMHFKKGVFDTLLLPLSLPIHSSSLVAVFYFFWTRILLNGKIFNPPLLHHSFHSYLTLCFSVLSTPCIMQQSLLIHPHDPDLSQFHCSPSPTLSFLPRPFPFHMDHRKLHFTFQSTMRASSMSLRPQRLFLGRFESSPNQLTHDARAVTVQSTIRR